MNDVLDPSDALPVRRRRRWLYILAFVVLAAAALVGVYIYLHMTADSELQAALADTYRLDPRWRLQDVEEDRAAVPDDQNSGTVVIAAKGKMPKGWPFDVSHGAPTGGPPIGKSERELWEGSFQELDPARQLADEQTAALRTEMNRAAEALVEARKLADLPQGRFSITYGPMGLDTQIPHTQETRDIATLLGYDAILRVQDGDGEGALSSCRGIVNAGRSIGDEPLLVSQLVRIAGVIQAATKVERVLAQGEPSDETLHQIQGLLEKEEGESESLFQIAVRGDRAGLDQMMEAAQSGKVSPRDLYFKSDPPLSDQVMFWTPGFLPSERAAMLRYHNHIVAIAELPSEQRSVAFRRLQLTSKEHVFTRLLCVDMCKISDAFLRKHVLLRSASAAAAAERYRRAKGRWPDSLDALVDTGYLREVPTDPYDGQPLRFRRLEDGLVIYSIGPDQTDDGGKIDRQHPLNPGTDIGFRLWDPDHRRQPPAPFKPPAAAGK